MLRSLFSKWTQPPHLSPMFQVVRADPPAFCAYTTNESFPSAIFSKSVLYLCVGKLLTIPRPVCPQMQNRMGTTHRQPRIRSVVMTVSATPTARRHRHEPRVRRAVLAGQIVGAAVLLGCMHVIVYRASTKNELIVFSSSDSRQPDAARSIHLSDEVRQLCLHSGQSNDENIPPWQRSLAVKADGRYE